MIVGANGCGKTTVIECLKYSTTGAYSDLGDARKSSQSHDVRPETVLTLLSSSLASRSRRGAAAGHRQRPEFRARPQGPFPPTGVTMRR
jgi:ABC-type molybdenum transport system ATPase subunit/photorepair protein PhrA